jgi:L-iditol 2-dehydrogenase
VADLKAAIYKGIGKIEIEDIDTPTIQVNEGLVKIGMVGVCGTDIKTFNKGHHMFKPPCILGHEFTGRIVERGASVDRDFGDSRYVIAPYIECGKCEMCQKGVPELCSKKFWVEGAFTEYVKVPSEILERATLKIPDDVPESTATLTEPLACAIHGIDKARIKPEDRVLVVGSGPMGLLLGNALKNMRCETYISDVDKNRLSMAANCGLKTIDFSDSSFESFKKSQSRFDSIILANDKKELVNQLLPFVCPGGTFELFGGMSRDTILEIDPYFIHYKEVDLVGTFGFSEKDFKKAFGFITSDPDSFSRLISRVWDLENIDEAFKDAIDKTKIKIVVKVSH